MTSLQAHSPQHLGARWLEAARSAIIDIGRQALGSVVGFGKLTSLPTESAGALIPIVSNRDPVQIGLFSSQSGCEVLARSLLGSDPGDKLSRADIVDAMGEVVNMLSGSVKSRVAHYATHAALGLPTFVHGPVELQSGQALDVVHAVIAGADVFVVILHAAH